MRILPTRIHGVIDYAVGLLLIALPYLFGFATGGPKHWIPVALGAGAIAYSLITRYELGAFGLLSMPVHLGLDVASGVLLASSPWLFGFANEVFWPHMIVGLMEIATASITQTAPSVAHGYAAQRPIGR
jgi:hypothetical protein